MCMGSQFVQRDLEKMKSDMLKLQRTNKDLQVTMHACNKFIHALPVKNVMHTVVYITTGGACYLD